MEVLQSIKFANNFCVKETLFNPGCQAALVSGILVLLKGQNVGDFNIYFLKIINKHMKATKTIITEAKAYSKVNA